MKTLNNFEFSTSTGGFDAHILNSIPGYGTLLDEIVLLSHHWINEGFFPVIDIGGSTGKLLDAIQKSTGITTADKFFSVDPTTFDTKVNNDLITHIKMPAQDYLNSVKLPVELFFSIFTLQFLDSDARDKILQHVSDNMSKDGAFIIAEKFYMEDSEYQEVFSVILRDLKRKSFSDQDILDKDVKLLKHLKLKTEKEFLQEMHSYRLKPTKFFQSLHFNGYICTHRK